MRIALFEPEIAGNVGAVLRLAACFAVPVDIVEPCGFVWNDARLRRSGMDYVESVVVTRHRSWAAFAQALTGRLILLTTKGAARLPDFAFQPTDTLLFGRESAGVPDSVADVADARLRIPLIAGVRSLNLAVSCGIAVAEALRQTGGFPE